MEFIGKFVSPEIISHIPFIDLQEMEGKGFSNNLEMSHIGLSDIEKVVEKFRLFSILFLADVQVDVTYKIWDPWKQKYKCYYLK